MTRIGKFAILKHWRSVRFCGCEKERMRKNVLDYEPSLALFVPDDDPLVFYRAAAEWMDRFLAPDGVGFVEINESLGEETAGVFRFKGYAGTTVLRDFYGRDRFLRIERKLPK